MKILVKKNQKYVAIPPGATLVTVNFSAHCKVKNHFLEFSQAQ